MKTLLILAMPLFASRIDDCFARRGDRSPEAVRSMTLALEDPDLRSCAAENLRVAEAVEPLRSALQSSTPETRAVAARTLGTFKRTDLIDPLADAASDPNLLVASNAMAGLMNYSDAAVLPALDRLARKGGMVGDLALERLLVIAPELALPAARHLLATGQVPDRLYALRVIADLGDATDLPALEKIAADSGERLESRSRGFGLMPAISLSRSAQTAIENVRSRVGFPAK
jgi:HEAT repeat protein